MITFNQYQQEALTTAIYPLERALDYTVLGLVSEIAELVEVWFHSGLPFDEARPMMRKEAGDCWWYTGAVADALKLDLQAVASYKGDVKSYATGTATITALAVHAGNLAGLVKKAIRDDNGTLSTERAEKLVKELHTILWLLDGLSSHLGTTRHAIMNANLNKLADRKARGVLQGSGDNR